MSRFARILTLVFALLLCVGSGCSKKSSSAPVGGTGGLRPESELKHNLCDWPAQEFSPSNHVSAGLGFSVGQYAIDFTLKDTSGVDYNLGTLLQTKPVFLIFGSCT